MRDISLSSRVLGAWRWLWRSGAWIPLFFLAFLYLRAPHLDPQDWDYDEGINLMKALLHLRGYDLYSEVWSDQPPLMTVTLAALFAAGGADIPAARLLIMVSSALLVWCVYLLARQTSGSLAAIAAALLVVFSEYYLRLSGALMIGLPALALATLSLTLLVLERPGWGRTVLSALVMALALNTKLISALVGPACVLSILASASADAVVGTRARLIRASVWCVIVGAASLLMAASLGAMRLEMLLGTHLGDPARQQASFLAEAARFFPHYAKHHRAYLVIAALGILGAIVRRDRGVLVPLVWLLTTAAALAMHRPLWYHYAPLLSVPLAWLCAFGVDIWLASLRRASRRPRKPIRWAQSALYGTLGAAVLALLWAYPRPLPERLDKQMSRYRPTYIPLVAEQLITDAGAAPGWVFTDRPFYAAQAGLLVPPPIAVLSRKRLESGIIGPERLRDVLRDYRPSYVLLERFTVEYGPLFMGELNAHYDQVLAVPPARYYRPKVTVQSLSSNPLYPWGEGSNGPGD